ncbi:MAG: hypothetical protein KatS3mg129_1973 [Leptospiraceae bacterium]|nr:MAG: hypothetical protein KatS3mg129_1973 [Leptospiraceae bacterium]
MYFLLLSILILQFYYKQQRLLQEKTIFLNSFTHELKTPLTAIKLNLQTLEKKLPKDKIIHELIKSSLYEIEVLNQKINKILYNKEIQIQSIKKLTEVSIQDVLNEVLKDLEKEIIKKEANIKINDQLNKEKIFLNIPSQWLSLILKEIILNSLKYSDKNVQIHINLKEVDVWIKKYLKIIIEDTGWGIEDIKQIKSITKPYIRYHNDKGYINGTGLGLYYVNEIIKKCKGKLLIKNKEKGLKVEVYLKKY